MAGWTNKAKADLFKQLYTRTVTMPTNYYIALVTSDDVPDADTNTMGDLTEIDDGNGYTAGGYELDPGETDFDFVEEDDTGNLGRVQIKDVEWTADGGPIPATGTAAYAVMTDDNVTPASRKILHYWSLGGERSVQDGSPFRLINLEIRALES
jgi:hypothetical protein